MTDETQGTGSDEGTFLDDDVRESMVVFCVEHSDIDKETLHDLDDSALEEMFQATESGVEQALEEAEEAEKPKLVDHKGDPVSTDGLNVAKMREVISKTDSLDDLEDMAHGETRSSVLTAIEKRRTQIVGGPKEEVPKFEGHHICVYVGELMPNGKAPNRIVSDPNLPGAFIDIVFEMREDVHPKFPVAILRDYRVMAQAIFKLVVPDHEKPRDRKAYAVQDKDCRMLVVKPEKAMFENMKHWLLHRDKKDHKITEDLAAFGLLDE